jgi:hypothetical protein
LLDFKTKNWEGIDKAWRNSLYQMSRIPAIPYVLLAESLADTSKLKRVFATVRCVLAKSETRVNKLQDCGVNCIDPVTGFHVEGSWCSCVISGFCCLEMVEIY